MNENFNISKIILEKRQALKFTQKDLAEKLNITPKAVSKWERGISLPDIGIIPALCKVLKIDPNLLLGFENSSASITENATPERINKKKINVKRICFYSIFSLFVTAALTCFICDFSINGTITWSNFVYASVIYSFLLIFPFFLQKKYYFISFINFSVFTFILLLSFDLIIGKGFEITKIGSPVMVIAISGLIGLYFILRSKKLGIFLKLALAFLLGLILIVLINFTLNKLINSDLFDLWDLFGYIPLGIASIVLFIIHVDKKSQ